ncbi:MAG TPA: helix-turn-helix domain-containing protein [Ramlibacter sp.]|uniref:helix-turn-helix domain-containing protein n=1 Tax=Ramlibacter sp. TaxID=1917967 RepID=UPI002BF96EF0|nr:helix-turn-helix domain-containing protein [Ramlibacter sp.]HVZ45746.1 helix-turn-helix domain-containing protein [Ramlibacter sp.]
MNARSSVFEDFHLHGGPAPEWNQRYLQMSCGVMRSSLADWSGDGVHAYRKWISERVVQQGGLPGARICLSVLGAEGSGRMRVQGREFGDADLLVLRGGDDFEFHRPAGAELLSLAFGMEDFLACLDEMQLPVMLSTAGIMRPAPGVLGELRRAIRSHSAGMQQGEPRDLLRVSCEALASAADAAPQRLSSFAAAKLVKRCQDIAMAQAAPLQIEDLCRRLHTSRRTLQASFNMVAGTTPLAYLRNLRLNAARRRLMSSPAREVNVSQAAGEAGFDHFGRFAGDYKALFGEAPSTTKRLVS